MSPKTASRILRVFSIVFLAVVFYAAWIDLGIWAALAITAGVALFGYAVFGRRNHPVD